MPPTLADYQAGLSLLSDTVNEYLLLYLVDAHFRGYFQEGRQPYRVPIRSEPARAALQRAGFPLFITQEDGCLINIPALGIGVKALYNWQFGPSFPVDYYAPVRRPPPLWSGSLEITLSTAFFIAVNAEGQTQLLERTWHEGTYKRGSAIYTRSLPEGYTLLDSMLIPAEDAIFHAWLRALWALADYYLTPFAAFLPPELALPVRDRLGYYLPGRISYTLRPNREFAPPLADFLAELGRYHREFEIWVRVVGRYLEEAMFEGEEGCSATTPPG